MPYEYKSREENFAEAIAEARSMSIAELKEILKDRQALQFWAVKAYEQVLAEKENKK